MRIEEASSNVEGARTLVGTPTASPKGEKLVVEVRAIHALPDFEFGKKARPKRMQLRDQIAKACAEQAALMNLRDQSGPVPAIKEELITGAESASKSKDSLL